MFPERSKISIVLILSLLSLLIISCKRHDLLTDKNATLIFTADTLRFDTIFTSVGSVTQYFTITNHNSRKLQIDRIRLMGDNASYFKINVDGIASPEVHNLVLDAGDSIYVFVSVNIDPATDRNPFLVQDSIEVRFNGNQTFIQLEAFGQNAHFVRNYLIDKDTIWTDDLPYVVRGGLQIAKGVTLTIKEGCNIYMHADALLTVDGTLKVEGTRTAPVRFQGDRLDPEYRNLPASWPGIFFRPGSINNKIQYGVIKNAYQGVIVQGIPGNSSPDLSLRECIIDNIYEEGILAIGSRIEAINCLISNCGSNIVLKGGGNFQFVFCTIAGYDNRFINHKNPVLSISTADEDGNNNDLDALFRNCIIWAGGNNVENEVVAQRKEAALLNINFDHVLYKAKELPSDIHLIGSIANQDPLFDSINVDRQYFDFHIGNKPSPAIGAGVPVSLPIDSDLDGKPRIGDPDLGSYTKD